MVASHLDDDPVIKIETLPLGSQLNIAANTLATKGLWQLYSKHQVLLDHLLKFSYTLTAEPALETSSKLFAQN